MTWELLDLCFLLMGMFKHINGYEGFVGVIHFE
jgi:hypothetical protein